MNNKVMASSPAEKPKLLIIDDDVDLLNVTRIYFEDQFSVQTASHGKEGIEIAHEWSPNLILLDTLLPKPDGIEICQKLRKHFKTRHIPILMLSESAAPDLLVRAFQAGADHFVEKPFHFAELEARLRCMLSRVKQIRRTPTGVMKFSNMTLEKRSREVRVDEKIVTLRPVEFTILQLLVEYVGEVISREEIMQNIWDDQGRNPRLIDSHVTAIRKKLKGFSGNLKTIYGHGYQLLED